MNSAERPYFLDLDGAKHYVDPVVSSQDTSEINGKLLKEKGVRQIDELANTLGVGVEVVQTAIENLREQGYGVTSEGGTMIRTKTKIKDDEVIFDASRIINKEFKFGIAGDTHLASKKERLEELNRMYDIFQAEGVTVVFHAGDVTDGVGVYRGQELEVKRFGQEEQIDYAVENYPVRQGITTYFITGNHDLRAYERGGIDIGYSLERRRQDMRYLGQVAAKVQMPNGVIMELLHPEGGIAYALSYKAQRYINNLAPSDVPNIMVWGHYHTSFYMHYRNVHYIQAPAFKSAGTWEKRLGLNPTIGGWVIEGKISDYGHVDSFRPELFTFDDKTVGR